MKTRVIVQVVVELMVTSTLRLVLVLFVLSVSADGFTYTFSEPAEFHNMLQKLSFFKIDEAKCEKIQMKKSTDYRRFSLTPMKWKSADACCKMRGMTLHTPERADEYHYLHDVLRDILVFDRLDYYWTSGNNLKDPSTFTWEYGGDLAKSTSQAGAFLREAHLWEDGEEAKTSGNCVAGYPKFPDPPGTKVGSLRLKKLDCDEEHRFICQIEPQLGGRDLNQTEIDMCAPGASVEYVPLAGGKVQFGTSEVRWPVARFCCEQNGWSLIGDIKTHQVEIWDDLTGLVEDGDINDIKIWTSLNDFCKDRDFRWICGHKSPPKWSIADPVKGTYNPDNYALKEDCGEFYWKTGWPKEFQGNDLNCDIYNYFLCDTTPPSCPKNQQFNYCDSPKRPRRIYPDEDFENDEETCNTVKFLQMGETDNYTFYISDKEITWNGAKKCLQKNGYEQSSFQIDSDIQFFTDTLITDPLTQIWNPATSWGRSFTNNLIWPDGSEVEDSRMLPFKTHDNVDPICGKLGVFQSKVGIMTESCLSLIKFSYKIPKNSGRSLVSIDTDNGTAYQVIVPDEPDPFADFNFTGVRQKDVCPRRSTMKLFRLVCNQTEMTVAPYDNQTVKTFDDRTIFKVGFQNARLQHFVVDSNMKMLPFLKHRPSKAFKLLSLSTTIYIDLCPDVPYMFLKNAFYYFHYLHWVTSQGRSELVTNTDHSWIKKLLQNCRNASTSLRYRTAACGEMIYSTDKCTNFICPTSTHQFNINKLDPLVHIMWKIYEMVHSACFDHFEESYRMFHLYSQAMMDLWSEDIRLRWFNQIENNKFWERVLGPNYELHLLNMDKCNEAVIRKHLNVRLLPENLPTRVRLLGTS